MAYRSRLVGRHTVTTPNPPMHALNVTPLIDVLLVLLVMVILSVPIATHQVDVDLPYPTEHFEIPDTVSLAVTQAGAVLWNGEAVSRPELTARLAAAARDPAKPVIRFEPDAQASYDASVQVINQISDARIDRFAFVGNEQYRRWDTE